MLFTSNLNWRRRPSMIRTALFIAAAWLLVIVLNQSGYGAHTDAFSSPGRFALGVISWLLMIVAMMLPASLGLLRLVRYAALEQTKKGLNAVQIVFGFVGAYFSVWLGFALLAWTGDAIIHALADKFTTTRAYTWLLTPVSVALAGAFQFSALKGKCLHACRNPASFFTLHYRKGVRGAARLGWQHGLHCLGCCWSLMLVMFAVGSNNLVWMIALTVLTMLERLGPHGDLLRKPIGIGLLLSAGLLVFTTR